MGLKPKYTKQERIDILEAELRAAYSAMDCMSKTQEMLAKIIEKLIKQPASQEGGSNG